jgi:hypothetical protein
MGNPHIVLLVPYFLSFNITFLKGLYYLPEISVKVG